MTDDAAVRLTAPAKGPAPRRRMLFRLLVPACMAAAAAVGWHSLRAAEAGAQPLPGADAASAASAAGGRTGGRRFGGGGAAQPVSVAAVRRQDIHVEVSAIGSLLAADTALVRPQVGGVLQALDFQEGQTVRAGQVLARIDPRPFQVAVGQAEGTLARDQAQLEGARRDLARYRGLLAQDAIARQQVDSQAALVGQLEGSVKADQAALDNARLQLSYTRVTAPIAGRVGLKQADVGNVVSPSDAAGIASITQTRPIALVFSVPASNVGTLAARLRAHEPLPVRAFATGPAGSEKPLAEGRVAALDNAIDPATDTVKVKALFPNTDDALFPNQAVRVRLQLDTLAGVLAVPQAGVLRGAQGSYVYVARPDGTVAVRTVQPGPVEAGWMAVQGTLEPGEQVVIDGTDRLRDGAKVELVTAERKPRGAGGERPAR